MKTERGSRNGSNSWVPGTHVGDLYWVPGSWLPTHPSLHHRSYLGIKPVLSLISFLHLWKNKVSFDTKIFKSTHTTSSQKFTEGPAVWGSRLKPWPTARTRTSTPMGCPCCRQRLLPLCRADQISLCEVPSYLSLWSINLQTGFLWKWYSLCKATHSRENMSRSLWAEPQHAFPLRITMKHYASLQGINGVSTPVKNGRGTVGKSWRVSRSLLSRFR